MAKPLWAPWRLEYIAQADEETGCIFCRAAESEDDEGLVVHRGDGRVRAAEQVPVRLRTPAGRPYRHVGEFGELTDEEALEVHRLAERGMAALAEVYGPRASTSAGTSAASPAPVSSTTSTSMSYPRWAGDTNFMPVLADVKVLPEHLLETRRRLSDTWPG